MEKQTVIKKFTRGVESGQGNESRISRPVGRRVPGCGSERRRQGPEGPDGGASCRPSLLGYQKGIPDRRNGSYIRHVLTGLGNIILSIPRTRFLVPGASLPPMPGESGDRPAHPRLFPFGSVHKKGRHCALRYLGRTDQPPDREQGGEDPG